MQSARTGNELKDKKQENTYSSAKHLPSIHLCILQVSTHLIVPKILRPMQIYPKLRLWDLVKYPVAQLNMNLR